MSTNVQNKLAALINKDIFTPTYGQSMAKQRLQEALEANDFMFDKNSLTLEQLQSLCRDKQLPKWAKEPGFLPWLLDRDDFRKRVNAYADSVLEVLIDIVEMPLEPKVITAKDKLQAVNLLMQLANKFPAKQTKVVVLDKELDKLGDDEVDKRIQEMQMKLISNPSPTIVDVEANVPTPNEEDLDEIENGVSEEQEP